MQTSSIEINTSNHRARLIPHHPLLPARVPAKRRRTQSLTVRRCSSLYYCLCVREHQAIDTVDNAGNVL